MNPDQRKFFAALRRDDGESPGPRTFLSRAIQDDVFRILVVEANTQHFGLSARICRLLGWEIRANGCGIDPEGRLTILPDLSHSLDQFSRALDVVIAEDGDLFRRYTGWLTCQCRTAHNVSVMLTMAHPWTRSAAAILALEGYEPIDGVEEGYL